VSTTISRNAHWGILLLAILAITPGLINFTAFEMLSPTIANDLGVTRAESNWVTLLGNAAVAFGFLAAVGMCRQTSLRQLTLAALGMLILASLCAAVAPNLTLLIASHALQGFATGLLSSALVLLLLEQGSPVRLPVTLTVLGTALFGAITLGPLVGGLVEHGSAWRALMAGDMVVALLAFVVAWAVVPAQPALTRSLDISILTLLLGALGLALVFHAVGQLSWYAWTRPQVQVPAVLGVAILLAVLAAEWGRWGVLGRSSLIGAATISCVAGFAFAGLLAITVDFLLRVRDLGAQDAGLLTWPAPAAALLGMAIVGLVCTRRRVILAVGVCGVLLLALAAWLLTHVSAFTGNPEVLRIAVLLGLGTSLSIGPLLCLTAYAVPGEALGRAVALVAVLPYVMMAAAGQVLMYAAGVRQTAHYGNLLWEQGVSTYIGAAGTLPQASTGAQGATSSTTAMLNSALVLGINDVAAAMVLIIVVGAAVALLLLRIGVRQFSFPR